MRLDTIFVIQEIEKALGPQRIKMLKRDEDSYQQFWLGVLEALNRVNLNKDFVGFLIMNGYGAVRNMKRTEYSKRRMRTCTCGKILGYRTKICPCCGIETESQVRLSAIVNAEGENIEYEDLRPSRDIDFSVDTKMFVDTLSGQQKYIARRWMLDRADLLFANHVKQIAFELDISAPRVVQIKNIIKKKFKSWYFDINE